MGIYGREFNLEMPSARKIGYGVMAIVVLVVVVGAAMFVGDLLKPKPLAVWFENNATTLNAREQTFLYVAVTNTTEEVLNEVRVLAEPLDKSALKVSPYPEISAELETVGPGEKREVKFMVNPLAGIVPGEYAIDVAVNSYAGFYAEQRIMIKVVE